MESMTVHYGLATDMLLRQEAAADTDVNEGLSLLKELVGQGSALVGDPNFYLWFGFTYFPGLIHEGVPQAVFMALPFNDAVPQGGVVLYEGFLANGG